MLLLIISLIYTSSILYSIFLMCSNHKIFQLPMTDIEKTQFADICLSDTHEGHQI